MRNLLLVSLCLAPLVATAQSSRVSGPVSGLVFEQKSRSLRPMVGVPGSSYLGSPLLMGLEMAAVAPNGALALVVMDGQLWLAGGLQSGAPVSAPIDGALAGADRIAWAADGTTAVVYSARSGQAQVLRDLAGSPAAGPAIDVAGLVSALAVSADGDVVAGLEDGVALVAAGSAPRPIHSAVASALAIRGAHLFVADRAAGKVWQIENFASAPAPSLFAEELGEPVGLQLSADGNRLYVADGKGRLLNAFYTATRSSAGQVELEFTPSELKAFGGRDVWLMNSDNNAGDPLYVATGAGEPAAWFVPAGREQ